VNRLRSHIALAHVVASYFAITAFFIPGYPTSAGEMLCVVIGSPITLPLWFVSMAARGTNDAGLSNAGAIVLASLCAVGFWVTWALLRRRLRLSQRLQFGCCPNCGYNLTGNTSGVCPECGTTTRDCRSRD